MNFMRFVRTAVAVSLLASSVSVLAEEYEAVTFTLTNGTGSNITHFYASPPSTQAWEADILGTDILPPGESVEITITDGRPDCGYDFKAVFDDDSELVHDAISVCGGESYVYQ